MGELFNSFAFIAYILLSAGIFGALRLKVKANDSWKSSTIADTAFFNILMVISILIAIATIVVLSVVGEWWFCFVMIGAFLILSSRLAKNPLSSCALLGELWFGGDHENWEAVIIMIMEAVFGGWLLVILL